MQENRLLDSFHYRLVHQNQFEFEFRHLVFLHNFNGAHLLAGTIAFKFLPILTQGLHFAVFVTMSRCMYGHNASVAMSVIPQLPGCVACIAFK